MKKSKHVLIIAATAVLSFSCALVTSCDLGGNQINPILKDMVVTGPSRLEIGKKGNLVVKEGDSVLTEGLTFKSSNEEVATISATGEVTALATGLTNITVSKEGYNNALYVVRVIEEEIVLKRMDIFASAKSIEVGSTIEFSAKEGDKVLTGVTFSIIKGSEFATIKGNVLTGVKEGKVDVKAILEGYNEPSITIRVTKAPVVLKDMVLNASATSVEVGSTIEFSAKEGDKVLTGVTYSIIEGSEFATLKDNVLTGISVGEVKVKGVLEGYNDATISVSISKVTIVLKDMTLNASEENVKVGSTITLSAKEDDKVLTGVTYSIIEGSEFATLEGDVLTGVKEGKVTVKGTLEGYNDATVAVEVIPAPEVAPSGYLRKLNKESFPKAVTNLGKTGTYVTEDVTEKVGETLYTFKSKSLGFANETNNSHYFTTYKAFQIKATKLAFQTSSNLTLSKVVIEQLTTFTGNVEALSLKLGDVEATPTFGRIENTGLTNKNGTKEYTIYKQFVTYSFPSDISEGALSITGAAHAGYFSNIYLYGTESVLKKEMSFVKENEEILVGHDFTLETKSTEETFDKGKVTYTIKSKEEGMDCAIEGSTLHAGKGLGKVEIEASLEGYISVTASFTIRDLYDFEVSTTPIELVINNDSLKTSSFVVNNAPTGIQLGYDEKVISVELKEGSYVVTALSEGTTEIKLNCTDYKEKSISVTVSFDNSIITKTDGSNMLTSSISSEDFKYAYKVTGTINSGLRENESFEFKTENGTIITVVDATFNKEALTYNKETKLFEFNKASNDTLMDSNRLVEGAAASMVLVRKDTKTSEFTQERKAFVGYFESISDLEPNSIELENKPTIVEGASENIQLKVNGNTNLDLTYVYVSNNAEVLEVVNNTSIKAIKPGTATITATCNEIPTLTVSKEFTVTEDTTKLNSIELTITTSGVDLSKLKIDAVLDYSVAINPTYYAGDLKFVVGTEGVVSIDEATKKITALKEGTTTIKVVATNPSVESNIITLTVVAPEVVVPVLKSISIKDVSELDSIDLFTGDESTVSVTLDPTDFVTNLEYVVSEPSVISVDKETGKVTALSKGTATLVVKSGDVVSNTLTYIVSEKVIEPTEISTFTASKTTLDIGEVVDTEFTTNPSKDTLSSSVVFTYSSSNENVATVDNATGKVTAVAAGEAVITISYKGLSKTLTFTIKEALVEPTEISTFTATKTTLDIGEVVDTEFTTNPGKESLSSSVVFTYTSSDEKIVTVDNTTGKVTAVAAGEATVTISYKEVSKTIIFTVKAPTSTAEAKVYDHTFKSGDIAKNATSATLSAIDWSIVGTLPYVGLDGTRGRGFQLGSKSDPITNLSFKTAISSLAPGKTVKVQSIEVNACMASSGKSKLTISTNGVASSEVNAQALTTTATSYKANFADVSTGDIDINFTNTAARATYIKSIKINFTIE